MTEFQRHERETEGETNYLIDRIVYRLYGLTEEISIVETSVKST